MAAGSVALFLARRASPSTPPEMFMSPTLATIPSAKITPAGVTTTIGGIAGHAGYSDGTSLTQFHSPSGIAVDGAGNVYVADTVNSVIRFIAANTSTVSTLAGTAGTNGSTDGTGGVGGTALFNFPSGIAVNSGGTLIYFADTTNDTIRELTSTGTTTTFAGIVGTATSDNGSDTAIFGGSAPFATFNNPAGVAVDTVGNLFVADTGGNAIRYRFTFPTSSAAIIGTQPTNQVVYNATGGTAVFSVFAAGNPAPTYQWLCAPPSGVPFAPLSNGSGIAAPPTATLSVTPSLVTTLGVTSTVPANGTQYEVVLNGSLTSSPATITVNAYDTSTTAGVATTSGYVDSRGGRAKVPLPGRLERGHRLQQLRRRYGQQCHPQGRHRRHGHHLRRDQSRHRRRRHRRLHGRSLHRRALQWAGRNNRR